MKRFARALTVMLGLVVLGSIVSFVPQKNAAAYSGAPVNIISPLPLPVTGSVKANITNSSVPVTVGNFPSFPATLTGATVPVSGTLREDKDLVDQPFATSICAGGVGTATCTADAQFLGLSQTPPASFTVPSADSGGNTVKRLVIQFVSGFCFNFQGSVILATTISPNPVNGITQGRNFLTASSGAVDQATNIVAGPGSTVGILGLTPPAGSCFLTVNGYLAH